VVGLDSWPVRGHLRHCDLPADPETGAATTAALTVTGQQLFSAVIDNHGLFRMPDAAP
jgi:uncharacterized membrane protein YdcZ (DUF606 family)